MSNSSKPWYHSILPSGMHTVGLKVPICVSIKNPSSGAAAARQLCRQADLLGDAQGDTVDLTASSSQMELTTVWREMISLYCLPTEAVRVYWAPQSRCLVVKARSTNVKCACRESGGELCGRSLAERENGSHLTAAVRNAQEKNQFLLKRIIPLPPYACAKYVRCFIDEARHCLVLKAKGVQLPSPTTTTSGSHNDKVRCNGLDADCCLPGEEERLHRYCQPRNLLLPMEQYVKRAHHGPQLKCITEAPEYFYGCKLLRKELKEVKRTSFPGLMKSPRFVRDEKSNHWLLRIVFRLRNEGFSAHNVTVKLAEERKRLLVLEAHCEMRDNTLGFVSRMDIHRQFAVPDLVDVTKMVTRYERETGYFLVDIPCIREKFTLLHKM